MRKTTRNTVLTVVFLLLTIIGVYWSRSVTHALQPVGSGLLTQANQIADELLVLSISQPLLEAGQVQQISVQTAPLTPVTVTTIYPGGSTDNPASGSGISDEQGRYVRHFVVAGEYGQRAFTVTAEAMIHGRNLRQIQQFYLTSSVDKPATEYVFPLLP